MELRQFYRFRTSKIAAIAIDVDNKFKHLAREWPSGARFGEYDIDVAIGLLQLAGNQKENHEQKNDVDHRGEIEPACQSSLVNAHAHGFFTSGRGSPASCAAVTRPRFS